MGKIASPSIDWYIKSADGADGSATTPYKISNADELAGLAQIVNGTAKDDNNSGIKVDNFTGKTIILASDIDLSDYVVNGGWIPIGNYAANYSMFSGTFKGCGHIISNLIINRSVDYQGLFGYIKGGWVGDFGLDGVNISGCGVVGSVAGFINNTIVSKAYSIGVIGGIGEDIGGIVGSVQFKSSVANCYSTCAVSGTGNSADKVGGVAGYVFKESNVINSAALNSRVIGTGKNIGRVVGTVPSQRATVMLSNIAYSGMITNANNEDLPGRNGVDITANQIRSDGTIGGYFATSEGGWTVENGKLPGFGGKAVNLPEHLKL